MKTDDLIAQLAQDTTPRVRQSFARHMASMLLLVAGNIALMLSIHGVREDIAARLSEPVFLVELSINALLILVLSYLAVSKQFPGRTIAIPYRYLVGALLFGYSLVVFNAAFLGGVSMAEASHGHTFECTLCILSFAVLPLAWLLYVSRKLAVTNPAIAGAMASLFALSVGSLGVRLVEQDIDNVTLILWHYIPVIVLSFGGIWLGKKLFRW